MFGRQETRWLHHAPAHTSAMNRVVLLTFGCFFLLSCAARADDASQPKELLDLQAKYKSDVDDAITPIKQRYLEDLKDLLQTEIIKGDANAVAAVQKEIQTLDTATNPRFIGKWTDQVNGESIIEFRPDGGWTEDFRGTYHKTGHWEMLSQNPLVIAVTESNGQAFHYKQNRSGDFIRDLGGLDYAHN
jgi:thioesterase domain-containing protein